LAPVKLAKNRLMALAVKPRAKSQRKPYMEF
jgi:hypothetical protein